MRPWAWASAVVVVGLIGGVFALFMIDSRQRERAERLARELERRRSEFVSRWSGTRWHDGPPCNALTVATDALDRATAIDSKETLEELRREAAPCATAFALDSLGYKDAPAIDVHRYQKAVTALLVHEMEGSDCLPGVLDVLDLAEALRVGGGVARMAVAHDIARRALAAGVECVGRSSVEELEPLVERAVGTCGSSYISGAVEWEYLRSSQEMQVLFSRGWWIPRFWDPALAPLSDGRTLLDAQEQLLGYASRASTANKPPYPRADERNYPERVRDLSALVDESAKALAHLAPFGPTLVKRAQIISLDQKWVAQRRAFACGIFTMVNSECSLCPAACSDPYSGKPLKLSLPNGKWVVYAVGEDGIEQGGEGDDQGVAFPWPLRQR
jgi:hypothetical protein